MNALIAPVLPKAEDVKIVLHLASPNTAYIQYSRDHLVQPLRAGREGLRLLEHVAALQHLARLLPSSFSKSFAVGLIYPNTTGCEAGHG